MQPGPGYLRDAPLFPPRASEMARQIDLLFFTTLGVTIFFSSLIAILIFYFMIRYRRTSPSQVGREPQGNTMMLEAAWIIVPLALALAIFTWGARIYFAAARPPPDARQFYVVGKQWMWKVQQPNGLREINEMHVPINRDIKLVLASEDVIHDFFVPAFRVKMDVVPGHYNTMWFRPTKTGRYHFFCSQYCGTNHAVMGGWVTVMDPSEYAAWLSGSQDQTNPTVAGEKLFVEKACSTCHLANGTGRAPSLNGLYGNQVTLADGSKVVADDGYIRESILQPQAKIVAGYQPVMPSFQGQLTEEQILALTAYIRSLQAQPAPAKGSGVASATGNK
jgi:cytochrome c oxidase subunit II